MRRSLRFFSSCSSSSVIAGFPFEQKVFARHAAQDHPFQPIQIVKTIPAGLAHGAQQRFPWAAERGCVDAGGEPLVIVDEASMLDLPLVYSMVRALPARSRLVLVGDPYQLPPIGFGLVFQVLATSPNIPRVELVEVHRQAQSSGIPQIAREIRHAVAVALPSFAGVGYGVSFIEIRDDEMVEAVLRVRAAWSGCDDVQVLCVIKRG